MKANLLLILLLGVGTAGCASPYKHVLVSVVDSVSGNPVSGATVTTHFPTGLWWTRTFRRKCKAVTDDSGKALLKVYWSSEPKSPGLAREIELDPIYDVMIHNDRYDYEIGTGDPDLTGKLFGRSEDFIPTKPDVVVEVMNRRVWERGQALAEEKRKSDEGKAEELSRGSPDFWPEHKEDSNPWIKDDVGQLLLSKRWQSASKKPLGTKEDVASIRTAVVHHMMNPRAEVEEIRWLSPSLVMVSSGWYAGPLAAAAYTYVLQKGNDGWIVLAYYLEALS